ncbi:hypothetical protein CDL12_02735 [Handroanthus impetiginosus]|uniref:Uncharacterized protein n=1 Tax=Handroanthus impetiginosus TaxID=429701 RepID=A0A2G9I4K2_9LAMI|nr:hypothetical protein CDL12_02735 [Handroanthus impetiginosus]
MALAEARAAWQRTANRCFVQEDAKRAPKLACCSTVSPSVKQADTGPTSAACGLQIPATGSLPFNLNPSCSNLSPNSKWWLQLPPNYGYKKGLMDEQFDSLEGNMESYQMHEIVKDPFKLEIKENIGELGVEGLVGCEVSKSASTIYFDSESSWIGAEESYPWWRTADTDELALLVARKSLNHIENCDLPNPQNTHLHAPASLTAGRVCQELGMSADGQVVSYTDMRDIPNHERIAEMQIFHNDRSKAQLMEALCHSQTRAREAERAARQACEEKDHVVKLVFKQASQLFAYKQLLDLLQLENMYLQFINNKSQSVSIVFPAVLPWKPQRTGKLHNPGRKRAKVSRPWYDSNKYAIVFALGFGLVGAGFLLGWTVGWMLPTW